MTKTLKNTFTITQLKDYQFEITTLILALVVRLINLSKSIWLDEAWALKFASASFSEIISNQWERNPPLYYLILKIWILIFGTSEVSLRLPSVIFGILSLLLFYLLLKKLFNLPVARLGLLLATLSPALIDISQTARTYSLLCFCSVSVWYGLLLWKEKTSFYSGTFLTLMSALMIYSHHFGILNFIALLSYSFYLILCREIKIIPTSLIYFAVVMSYLPYLPLISSQSQKLDQTGFWITEFSTSGLFHVFDYLVLNSGSIFFGLFVFLLVIVVTIFNAKKNRILPLLLWIVFPLALAILYSIYSTSIFLDRYFITLSFPLIAILSLGISKIKFSIFKSILLFGYLISSLLFTNQVLQNTKEDWPAITQEIEDNYQAGDLILIHPLPYKYPFSYYSSKPVATHESLLDLNFLHSYNRIWLIESDIQKNYLPHYLSEYPKVQEINVTPKFKLTLREKFVD